MVFQPQLTADGSYTFFSSEFQEAFHSRQGAKTEALEKFTQPCLLSELALRQKEIRLLDVCYGLGYNTAIALDIIWRQNPNCRVILYALEQDPQVPQQAFTTGLLAEVSPKVQGILKDLLTQSWLNLPTFQGQLLIGDARQTLR